MRVSGDHILFPHEISELKVKTFPNDQHVRSGLQALGILLRIETMGLAETAHSVHEMSFKL